MSCCCEKPTLYKLKSDQVSRSGSEATGACLESILYDIDNRLDPLNQCCCSSGYNKDEESPSCCSNKMSKVNQSGCHNCECTTGKANQNRFSNDCMVNKGIQCPALSATSSFKKRNKEQETWAEYIQKKVIHSGCVDEAALYRLDGRLMAKVGLDGLTQQDVKQLVAYLKRPQDSFRTGIDVCGRKYMYLSGSTNILRGKDINDEMGIIVTKGNHTIFIGLSRNLPYLGACDYVLDKQTAYLEMVGY